MIFRGVPTFGVYAAADDFTAATPLLGAVFVQGCTFQRSVCAVRTKTRREPMYTATGDWYVVGAEVEIVFL